MECPKRYGAYDQRNDDCKKCGQAHLYQVCLVDRRIKEKAHAACAGWNDKTGQPHCCEHLAKVEAGEMLR